MDTPLLDGIKKASLKRGGIKMGSLTKIAENNANKLVEKRSNMGLLVKTAEEEVKKEELSAAETIKLSSANLFNFVAAAKAGGRHIKEASTKEEINHDLITKIAKSYVDDHYKSAK